MANIFHKKTAYRFWNFGLTRNKLFYFFGLIKVQYNIKIFLKRIKKINQLIRFARLR